jgi:valyl-tRNA synthetase
MDDDMSESVLQVFVDLYNKGLIYRGYRMVNWDPEAKTTVSDEEVIYKESQGKLYYLRYQIEGEEAFVTIATTRPETILGDTAVCYHPEDERFQHLKGKRVIVPIANRSIPLIADEYVDREFGTGCLKITPAHDPNDKILGDKYQLEFIDIFNDDATLNEHGLHYKGMDRFACRKAIVKELESNGSLVKTEDYQNKVGTSERTGAVIEPRLSYQWFLAMEKLAEPALKAVMEDAIQLVPEKFKNTYRHWMENVRDWNISRQLWWGHRIPAWYYGDGMQDFVVAMNEIDALNAARAKTGNPDLQISSLHQEDDVLDTWFSSWLWPISVFDGIRNPNNPDIKYYYPTNDLVTAPEILFFWVARMIMAGYEWQNDKPFKAVYLTGIVRDKLGRKMSKSLGNSPDPIDLMKTYGADGVRVGMLLTSPAGNDLPFDEALCEQGRNFNNKIWNAMRLVKGWQIDSQLPQDQTAALAVDWFRARLDQTLTQIEDHFSKYRLSDALMAAYKLTWDDFCSWYLEMIKPQPGQAIDSQTLEATIGFFEDLMKLLHPFMPFITEEIWHLLRQRNEGDDLIVARMPSGKAFNQKLLADFDFTAELINGIRKLRASKNIPFRDALEVQIVDRNGDYNSLFEGIIAKLCNLSRISLTESQMEGAFGFVIKSTEVFVPLTDVVNPEEERKKLKEELIYTQGFLNSVNKKLSNERFVSGAPEQVVARERQKKADAEARIKVIEQQLKSFQ